MFIETKKLIGAQLDWSIEWSQSLEDLLASKGAKSTYSPSTDWEQGGLIIERERLNLRASGAGDWVASTHDMPHPERILQYGPTALIAAMRCFVTREMGEVVEVPDELCSDLQSQENEEAPAIEEGKASQPSMRG